MPLTFIKAVVTVGVFIFDQHHVGKLKEIQFKMKAPMGSDPRLVVKTRQLMYLQGERLILFSQFLWSSTKPDLKRKQ